MFDAVVLIVAVIIAFIFGKAVSNAKGKKIGDSFNNLTSDVQLARVRDFLARFSATKK